MTAAVDRLVFTVLTDAERKVLACLMRGFTNQQIAAVLFMSVSTVKAHVRALFVKCQVRNRVELAALALQAGFTEPSLDFDTLKVTEVTNGRPPLPFDAKPYTVLLDVANAEWARQQPGGLSQLMRALISWERWLREAPEGSVVLADAKAIALRGVTGDLDPAEVRDLCGLVLRIAEEVCDG